MDATDADPSVRRAAIDEVVRRERLLLQPRVRARRESVLALLHADFVEHGSSGRRWDRLSIADALTSEVAEPIAEPIQMEDIEATALKDGVVLVTYLARSGASITRRSSVWLRTEGERGEWLLRFHQGTPAAQE